MSTTESPITYKAPEGLGQKRGPNSELTTFFKVKPGHEQQIVADLDAFQKAVDGSTLPFEIGLHDSRIALFDNDTRLAFCTTFDGDMDKYVDDALIKLAGPLHAWARHLEGYPSTMDTRAELSPWKEWLFVHFVTSMVYTRTFPRTLKEYMKAVEVNDAFQQVLDDPASHKAFEDPALKPLLDLAAE